MEVPVWALVALGLALGAVLTLAALAVALLLRARRTPEAAALATTPVAELPAPAASTGREPMPDAVAATLFAERLAAYRSMLDAAERVRSAQAELNATVPPETSAPAALRRQAARDAFSASLAALDAPFGQLALVAPAPVVDIALEMLDGELGTDYGESTGRFLAAARADLGSDRMLARD